MEREELPKGTISIAWLLVLGALPPMLNTTIINIAVNSLANIFATSLAVTQWIVTGYVLALGIAVPFSGWLMRRYDGKNVYLGALSLFLLASALGGFRFRSDNSNPNSLDRSSCW